MQIISPRGSQWTQALGGRGNRKPLLSCPSPSTDWPEHLCKQGNLHTDCQAFTVLVQTLFTLSLLPRREMHASSLILYWPSLSMSHIYSSHNWDQNPNKVTRRFVWIEAAKPALKSLMSHVRKKRKSQKLFSTKACEGISNVLPSIMLITLL